ncbi:MAG: pilus assembly protein PilM [bacterium]
MSLFKSQKRILGVDLGPSSIKIVELIRTEKGIELGTYGYAKLKFGDIKKDSALEQEKLAALLQKICKEAKIKTTNTIASLPPFFVFSAIISIPQMQDKDIEAAVKWEAKKVIPLPLEQIELNWKIINMKGDINKTEKKRFDLEKDEKNKIERDDNGKANKLSSRGGDKIQLLLTGAAKKIVNRYMEIFKRSGLNLYRLETESFALSRSLLNKGDKMISMIVDIGALNTNISIIKFGIPFLIRSVDIGAFTITKIIANSMNISIERAEQFQYDIGIGSNDNNGDAVPKIIEESFSAVINEIKYSFNLYEEYKHSILEQKDKIEKIVLCGGGAMMPNLTGYLSNLLDIKVYIGNPWDRVQYNQDLKLVLDEIGPNFSVAIGLAMRDL